METLFTDGGWTLTRESAPLPDGRLKTDIRIHRADSVHIIAVPSPGRVLLLKEFRPFFQQHVWMIPSGKADKESDMAVAAQRELREETGYEAASLKLLSTVNFNDRFSFSNHIFLANDLTKNPLPPEEHEWFEVHDLPIDEALEKVLASPNTSLISAYALLRYMKENA